LARPVSEIVKRLVAQLVLERPARGHVAVVDDDAVDRRIVGQVAQDDLDPARGPVGVEHAQLGRRLIARRLQDLGHESRRGRPIIRLDGRERRLPHTLGAWIAEHTLDRVALIRDSAAAVDNHADVRAVVDERAEAPLARTEKLVLAR